MPHVKVATFEGAYEANAEADRREEASGYEDVYYTEADGHGATTWSVWTIDNYSPAEFLAKEFDTDISEWEV
jgi:hypothetical protein